MNLVDWRELYASNQAVIAQARGGNPPAPAALRRPAGPERPAGRDALVHVPSGLEAGRPVALVCLLHGCTQSPEAIAAATRLNEAADRHGFVAVYPRQDSKANPQACWNWFEPAHQARGAGEPARIAGIVRELAGSRERFTIDPRRVFLAGFSAGGAMASVVARCYPDLFAAVAVHSGLAYRAAANVQAAFAAMANGNAAAVGHGIAADEALGGLARPIPAIVVHGSEDRTVAAVNGRQVLEQFLDANRRLAPAACDFALDRPSAASHGRSDGGYAYTSERWSDPDGALVNELLEVQGLGHAWSGGSPGAPHSDPRGPDATEAIWRFFGAVAAQP